jgi:hypothetical protein
MVKAVKVKKRSITVGCQVRFYIKLWDKKGKYKHKRLSGTIISINFKQGTVIIYNKKSKSVFNRFLCEIKFYRS